MSSSKPAIIIISGAFGTPKSYGKLASALESKGYEVHVPRLPINSEARPPIAGLEEDTAFIRSYVEALIAAGRKVVAIAHSYGGQVMTNALYGLGLETRSAQGLEGGVSNLIYMTAFALPKGMSTSEKLGEFGNTEDYVSLVFDVGEDQSVTLKDHRAFFGLSEPGIKESEIEEYIQNSTRWNGKAMTQRLEHEAWWEIPVAYIHTTKDSVIPLAAQKSMVEDLEKAGRKVRTFTLDTAHAPHFTATDGVVDAINDTVSSSGPA